jgi:hypothetical protein
MGLAGTEKLASARRLVGETDRAIDPNDSDPLVWRAIVENYSRQFAKAKADSAGHTSEPARPYLSERHYLLADPELDLGQIEKATREIGSLISTTEKVSDVRITQIYGLILPANAGVRSEAEAAHARQ